MPDIISAVADLRGFGEEVEKKLETAGRIVMPTPEPAAPTAPAPAARAWPEAVAAPALPKDKAAGANLGFRTSVTNLLLQAQNPGTQPLR